MNDIQKFFYNRRKVILLDLYHRISYIDLHFKLIKDVYLRELGITDIKNLDENVKKHLCKPLSDLPKEKQFKLKSLCNTMNQYLSLKQTYGELPDDIKEHIASNVEFFYQIFSENWLEIIRSIVLDPMQGSTPQVFPINYLNSVFSLKSPIVDDTDDGKMIADIEKRFITSLQSINLSRPDENLQDWRVNELMGLIQQRPRQQQQSQINVRLQRPNIRDHRRDIGGKRSINYKVQRTRRPSRKSGTKRLSRLRRRSNRHSRTARK